jgi:hypothetical protein
LTYERSNWHIGRSQAAATVDDERYCGALAAVLATVFATLGAGSAQDFMAEPGVLAAAFPKADRPVANIVSPIWHDEKERDDAGG